MPHINDKIEKLPLEEIKEFNILLHESLNDRT